MNSSLGYLRRRREAAARRRLEVARILRDDPNATDIQIAEALQVSRNTIREDRRQNLDLVRDETGVEVEEYREEVLDELAELQLDLKNPVIKPDRKIELALSILDRITELKIPPFTKKAIVGHQSLGQLNALGLECQVILQDLGTSDQDQAVAMLKEFAKSRKKPVVVDAMILRDDPRLTEGS